MNESSPSLVPLQVPLRAHDVREKVFLQNWRLQPTSVAPAVVAGALAAASGERGIGCYLKIYSRISVESV